MAMQLFGYILLQVLNFTLLFINVDQYAQDKTTELTDKEITVLTFLLVLPRSDLFL